MNHGIDASQCNLRIKIFSLRIAQAREMKQEDIEERSPRRKKSRWSTEKFFLPGMPTVLPSNLDEQNHRSTCVSPYLLELGNRLRVAHLVLYSIEDDTNKLRTRSYSNFHRNATGKS